MVKQSAEIRPNVTIDESLEMETSQENLEDNIRVLKEDLELSSLICDNQLRKEYLNYLNENETLIEEFIEMDNEIETLEKEIMEKIIEIKNLFQEKSCQITSMKDKLIKLQTIIDYNGEDKYEFISKLISK